MRYLFINSVCGIRSTGRICTDLAQQLDSEGNECKIAYGRVDDVPEKFQQYAVRIGTDFDAKMHALQTRLFDSHGFCSKKPTKVFLKWADEYNPDVLWLHNIHGYYINVEMLFAWIKSRPNMQVKWTLHDCWGFTGHCSYFTAAKCEQWKTECRSCPQLHRYPACYAVGNVRQNFNRKKIAFTGVKNMTLITPSKWLADLVKQSFLKEYPVEVHYNTIDTAIFKPTPSHFKEQYGLQDKKIVLGVASVWDARKGLDDFLKLAEILNNQYAIVLVGLTKTQINKIPHKVICIERTNSIKGLAEIYTAADVFFNPTYEDNYPTVNLEAQACGTPVIAYDVGGTRETIIPGKGRIVPIGNINDVNELIPITVQKKQ